MSAITDVFEKARAYGFVQPNLVTNFAQLARMVREADEQRDAEEAEWEAQQDRAALAAWSNIYERNDRAREEDEAEIARADALGLWPYSH